MAPPDPDWVGGLELDVGDHPVGVQADSTTLLEVIREVFDPWFAGESATIGDFGISVERRGGAGPRLIPQLLHGRSNVLRSRSLPRLLRRLDVALAAIADPPQGASVRMAAVVHGERAALVPTAVAERSTAVERAVAAAGATIAEQAAVQIDLAAQVLVVRPGLTHPPPRPPADRRPRHASGSLHVARGLLVRGSACRRRTDGHRGGALRRARRPVERRRPASQRWSRSSPCATALRQDPSLGGAPTCQPSWARSTRERAGMRLQVHVLREMFYTAPTVLAPSARRGKGVVGMLEVRSTDRCHHQPTPDALQRGFVR